MIDSQVLSVKHTGHSRISIGPTINHFMPIYQFPFVNKCGQQTLQVSKLMHLYFFCWNHNSLRKGHYLLICSHLLLQVKIICSFDCSSLTPWIVSATINPIEAINLIIIIIVILSLSLFLNHILGRGLASYLPFYAPQIMSNYDRYGLVLRLQTEFPGKMGKMS